MQDLLVCPKCFGEFKVKGGQVICIDCGHIHETDKLKNDHKEKHGELIADDNWAEEEEPQRSPLFALLTGTFVFFVLAAILFVPGVFGYINHSVDTGEIGVLTQHGKFIKVLPPGLYSDPFMFGGNITNVERSKTITAISDALTGDQQIVTFEISSNLYILEVTEETWERYQKFLLDPKEQEKVVQSLIRQATQECTATRNFTDLVSGTHRSELSTCIDMWMETYVTTYQLGLILNQTVIPNVTIDPDDIALLQ